MPIVSSETISGKTLEMLGIVKGSTIQAVNAFKDMTDAIICVRYISSSVMQSAAEVLAYGAVVRYII